MCREEISILQIQRKCAFALNYLNEFPLGIKKRFQTLIKAFNNFKTREGLVLRMTLNGHFAVEDLEEHRYSGTEPMTKLLEILFLGNKNDDMLPFPYFASKAVHEWSF